jgi:thiopurine S-methyltransferase
MTPDFWHTRWQRGEIGWHLDGINRHLAQYWPELTLSQKGRVFVPLCGKSLDILWLAARGYGVLGVELSAVAVRQFFQDNGLDVQAQALAPLPFSRWAMDEVELLCGDFFDLTPALLLGPNGAGVDAVYDRASLIALPPAMRPGYASHLTDLLRAARAPDGVVESLLISLEYDQGRMSGPPFAVSEAEVRSLFEPGFSVERIASFDVLSEHPKFVARGLDALREQVYRLRLNT